MKFLCVLCVLCGWGSSALALDREAFTFTKYDLEVRLEPEQQRLGARGRITLRNDSAQPQKVAVLQISSSLDWRSIKVDGKAVQIVSQGYTSDIDHTGALLEAIVTLPAEIKPKDSVEVEVGYEGTIPLDATRLTRAGVPVEIAKHTSWDQISVSFTAVRGAGYVTWYPIATESANFSEGELFQVVDRWKKKEQDASMKLSLHTDAGTDDASLMLLCNGVGLNGDTRGGSPHYHWAACEYERFGLATPAFVVASYQTESKPPLTVFSLSGHEAGAAKYSSAVEPATKFVSEWFGPPRAPIAIADMADPHAAPYESGTLLLTSMAAEDAELAAINLVHELTHAALSSPRPWIHEGLAHFAEAVFREKQKGRQAALVLLGIHRAAFLEPEIEVARSPQTNSGQPLATTFDETYYRSKAAYVWWMLRDLIGDAALRQAIGKYRAEEDKSSKYVEQLVESAAKRDLGWFFDDWVYHDRGLPDFHVQSVHPWKNERGVQIVTVTIQNLGSAGAEVPFTVRFEGGEVTRRIEVRAKFTATTRVEVPGAPTEIAVNDGSVPESDVTNNVFKISGQ
jgi:hypothetical protein